jgi:basic amino acid/polyamine antiporter, APA family
VLVTALMLMNYTKGLVDAFTFVILLATLTTLVPYAYSAAAQAYLYVTERERFSPRHFLRDIAIAALAFAYSVWAIAGSGQEIIAKGFVLLLAGVPIYVGMRWWQQRDAGRGAVELTPSERDGKASTNGEVVAGAASAKQAQRT